MNCPMSACAYRPRISKMISGYAAAILKRVLAGAGILRFPCSQFFNVYSFTPMNFANSDCESFKRALTSLGLSGISIASAGLISPPVPWLSLLSALLLFLQRFDSFAISFLRIEFGLFILILRST